MNESPIKIEIGSSKHERYAALVTARKSCSQCNDVVNPSSCAGGRFDQNGHIGPWTDWQGNLDCKLMVIGQDWGGTAAYELQSGRDRDGDPTNKHLVELMMNIDHEVPNPSSMQGKPCDGQFYFTNAVLCLRSGSTTSHKKGEKAPVKGTFRLCGELFLRKQIEIVEPRAVFVLGGLAWFGLLTAFGRRPKEFSRESHTQTVGRGAVELSDKLLAIPLFHCGGNGTITRKLNLQTEDWQNAIEAVDAFCKQKRLPLFSSEIKGLS